MKREAVYPVLHTLYRHAMKRGPFEPIHFIADVYPAEAAAAAGSDSQVIARISREQSQIAPRCDNRVPYDFGEQVDRAFAASLARAPEENLDDTCRLDPPKALARFDDTFTHKPAYKIDASRQAVEVTFPYLEMGKDEYVETLKLTSALTYWIEFVTSLFRRVPDLKEVGYVGLHGDEPVVQDHRDPRAVRARASPGCKKTSPPTRRSPSRRSAVAVPATRRPSGNRRRSG